MAVTKLMIGVALTGLLLNGGLGITASQAQSAQAPARAAEEAVLDPEPLTAAELEILVARIALYPDELVAVISAASLYPLQIVEAQRYLDQVKTKPDLKPKAEWDGSVVSLLNYPEIVNMMGDDLDWTQALGEALAERQKDVLLAIQQLRDKAVAEGILKSSDKVKVVRETNTIVIQPASTEVIYVPQYQPQMLYEPSYVPVPVTYYPDPYPYYYDPVAPYFAAFVTGAVWGAVVDWNDWGVWGGHGGWGNDINIDCNHCFNNNNFNGRVNINDVDWKNVDRNKIRFDKNQLTKVDRIEMKNTLKANDRNSIRNKSVDLNRGRSASLSAGKGNLVPDVRKSTLEGLQAKSGSNKPKPRGLSDVGGGAGSNITKSGQIAGGSLDKKPGQIAGGSLDKKSGQIAGGRLDKKPGAGSFDRPAGKPKPAAKIDNRPSNPSPFGEINRGMDTKLQSNRGGQSMGGGIGGGSRPKKTAPPLRRRGG